jgi:hypothetical protein
MMHIPYYLLVMIALILWWHYCVKPAIEYERRRKWEIREYERKQREELEWYERYNRETKARNREWYEKCDPEALARWEELNKEWRAQGKKEFWPWEQKEIWPWYEEPPWEKEFRTWARSRSSKPTTQDIVNKIVELSTRQRDEDLARKDKSK